MLNDLKTSDDLPLISISIALDLYMVFIAPTTNRTDCQTWNQLGILLKKNNFAERLYISILEFSMWKIIFDFFKQNISYKKNDHITFWKFFVVYIKGTRDKY